MSEPNSINRLVLIVQRGPTVLLQPRGDVHALPGAVLGPGEAFESAVVRLAQTAGALAVRDLRWHALVNLDGGLVVVLGCEMAGGDAVTHPWTQLPALDAETKVVLEACRRSPQVLDRTGTPLPVGPASTAVEPTAESFRRGRGSMAGYWAATLLLAGLLAWALAVIVSLAEARLLDGGTALFASLIGLGTATTIAVRHGYTEAAGTVGRAVRRGFLSLLVAFAFVSILAFLLIAMDIKIEPFGWFMTIVGAGVFIAVSRLRPALKSERGIARGVRGLVWVTLAFTTLFALSPALRSAIERMHGTPTDTVTAVDDD
jgi:hypothetical protein